jgi:hypothetical protein
VAGVLKIGEILGQGEQDNVLRQLAKKYLKIESSASIEDLRAKVFNYDGFLPGSLDGILALDKETAARRRGRLITFAIGSFPRVKCSRLACS